MNHFAALSRVIRDPATLQAADLPAVLAAGLGGAIRARLPEQHPLREPLRQQAVDLALRHAHIRAELRPLLAAWQAAGIPAVLFKGFALAEFEYATPGERFHGDVDVLLPHDPAVLWRAVDLALAHGWRSDGQHADPDLWTHEMAHLYSPGGHIRLDVHRFVVGLTGGISPRQAAELTAGFWQRARPHDWQGLSVLRPDPLDAAVLNIGLGRSWGGDSGGIKPADYLDLELLVRRHGLSAAVLEAHAGRLGGAATWAAFCQCCDPLSGRLSLDPAQTFPVIGRGVRADGLRPGRVRWLGRGQTFVRLLPLFPATLLDVAAAWASLRRGGDPRKHLARWTPPGVPHRLSLGQLNNTVQAVTWWTRLLYPRQFRRGVCVPRAYATYRALRRAGHPAQFFSGVSGAHGAVTGHAWVEDDRGAIEFYGEPLNRQRFRVLFRYPESP